MSFLATLSRRRGAHDKHAPWLGVHAGEAALLGALGLPSTGARPRVELMPPAEAVSAASVALHGWRSRCRRRVRANVVLRSTEYRVLPITQPLPLAAAELKEAARWQVADVLDFSVEDAAIDLLALPQPAGGTRNQHLVVAAQSGCVRGWAKRCNEAGLPLGAVDIPEMAMRNLSVLAAADTPHAFLYVGLRSTRLAVVWQRELCSFRQLGITARDLLRGDEATCAATLERLALEIQRTADSYTRQFAGSELQAVWLTTSASEPQVLAAHLEQHIAQRVRVFDVEEHVQVEGGRVADAAAGRDYLLAVGAALRREAA